jgi:tRNA C32,U32 (ribose-2'-O)-methylase TrmJ
MTRNLRDMILRMAPSEQDVRTLHGVVRTLAQTRLRKT